MKTKCFNNIKEYWILRVDHGRAMHSVKVRTCIYLVHNIETYFDIANIKYSMQAIQQCIVKNGEKLDWCILLWSTLSALEETESIAEGNHRACLQHQERNRGMAGCHPPDRQEASGDACHINICALSRLPQFRGDCRCNLLYDGYVSKRHPLHDFYVLPS